MAVLEHSSACGRCVQSEERGSNLEGFLPILPRAPLVAGSTGGAQWVQIRTGDSELLPVLCPLWGLGSGLYVPIGAICLQIHLILSLY